MALAVAPTGARRVNVLGAVMAAAAEVLRWHWHWLSLLRLLYRVGGSTREESSLLLGADQAAMLALDLRV